MKNKSSNKKVRDEIRDNIAFSLIMYFIYKNGIVSELLGIDDLFIYFVVVLVSMGFMAKIYVYERVFIDNHKVYKWLYLLSMLIFTLIPAIVAGTQGKNDLATSFALTGLIMIRLYVFGITVFKNYLDRRRDKKDNVRKTTV